MSPLWVSDPKVCPLLDVPQGLRPDTSVVRILCANVSRLPRITSDHPHMLSKSIEEDQFLPGPSWDLSSAQMGDERHAHLVG